MIIRPRKSAQFEDRNFGINIACSDYILSMSKIVHPQRVLRNLRDYFAYKEIYKLPYDYDTFFMPNFIRVETFHSSKKESEINKCLELNNKLVLSSHNIIETTDKDTIRNTIKDIIIMSNITKLFEHMRGFIENKKISEYKVGYDELVKDINDISNQIVAYVRDKYPDAEPNEEFLQKINSQLWMSELPVAMKRIRQNILDYAAMLLQTTVTIRLRGVKIKLEGIMGYEKHNYQNNKKMKKFIINVAILSFIKAMPFELWMLCNRDALSILVKPNVNYLVIREYTDAFRIRLKPDYYLLLTAHCTLVNRVNPIIISINISGLSFLLKSNSVKNFFIALCGVINELYNKAIKLFPGRTQFYSKIVI